jgi:RNA polymerase sigma-70 factor (ECF subfamily)
MNGTIARMAVADGEPSKIAPDPVSQGWLDGLRSSGARHEQAVRELHAVLLRAARREVQRRRALFGGAKGPELDDLAQQAADDALLAILNSLETYRGASRFTTWAYRFVINHVSIKTRRHLWSGRRVPFDDVAWDRLPDRLLPSADRRSEQRAQLEALRNAVENELSARQREVFVAAALNEVPIDVVALRLDSNRGAIYKTLFDARTKLRGSLAAAGYPVTDKGETP